MCNNVIVDTVGGERWRGGRVRERERERQRDGDRERGGRREREVGEMPFSTQNKVCKRLKGVND